MHCFEPGGRQRRPCMDEAAVQGSAKIWDLQCVASKLVNAGSRVCVCNQATGQLPPTLTC